MEFDLPSLPASASTAFDVVVIGASLGGLEALARVLAPLPSDFPVSILVAQHTDARSPFLLPELLARRTTLRVERARHGESLGSGTVHLAPPGRHLLVTPQRQCALSDRARVSYARPAVDVLFTSAAEAFGARTLGVVLTGRLSDGAKGAMAIRRAGGVVLAQDPATCRAPDMPSAAIRCGAAQLALPPAALGAALVALVAVPGVPALFGLRPRAVA